MDFKLLTQTEIEALAPEALASYFNEKNDHDREVMQKAIDEKASKEDIQRMLDEKDADMKAQMEALNKALTKSIEFVGLELKKIKMGGMNIQVNSKEELREALEKMATELKAHPKDSEKKTVMGKDGKPFEVKQVGTMSVTSSVTGDLPIPQYDPGFNDFNKRTLKLRELANKGTTTSDLVRWVYKAAKEGSAGMTAEGSVKTQLDWTYVVDSAEVKKITSYIKITKEMLDDIDGIMADIQGELRYEIDYLEETQLKEGVGTTVYLNGIEKYAQPLDNAGLAGTIPSPNYWDVIGAAVAQIDIETEGRSKANAILLNRVDIFKLRHAVKTATEKGYIVPIFTTPNGMYYEDIPILQAQVITAGEFLVGDFTKFHLRDREGLTLSMGWDGNDFTYNLITILGEKRLVSFVKKNDEAAFVTDAFSDGITFLTAS